MPFWLFSAGEGKGGNGCYCNQRKLLIPTFLWYTLCDLRFLVNLHLPDPHGVIVAQEKIAGGSGIAPGPPGRLQVVCTKTVARQNHT
jgi:hypothetical protein